jgi:Domain of unknown function (DUF4352)
MNRIVPVIEWLALLPLWRRVAKGAPLQFLLASATAALWPILIVVVLSSGDSPEPAAEGAISVRAVPGAEADAEDVRIILHEIANPSSSVDLFQPTPDGTRLVAFEVTLEFLGSEGTHMANPFHFKLIDSADFVYAEVLGGPEPVLNAISLSPGQKTRGWIAFEVQSVSPLKQLKYDADVSTVDAVEFSFQ